jgi:hypothetical protein
MEPISGGVGTMTGVNGSGGLQAPRTYPSLENGKNGLLAGHSKWSSVLEDEELVVE